jgi:hypothetical protein
MKRIIALLVTLFALVQTSPAQAASTTFYLKAVAGQCYSFNSSVTSTYRIGTEAKTLYNKSCTSKHHAQIIKTGIVKKSGTLTQDEVWAYCDAAYRAKYKKASPVSVSAGALYLRYFYADPGPELIKYGRIAVCYVHKADAGYNTFTPLTRKY